MAKNILVLSGSPRQGGNSDLLAEAFIKGAESKGHNVKLFAAGQSKIDGCIACDTCFSKGAACSFADDFNELAKLLAEAELLVYATPLCWFSFPAQIKAAIDKIYSFMVAGKKLPIQETMLLACGETSDLNDFAGLVKSYELINNYLGWQGRGRLLVPDVNKKGDILQTEALAQAEALGAGI